MRRIAVIGGGFSGVMQAIQLLRHTEAHVTLIERPGRLARGAAYGTRRPEHLLNVRASGMSAFPEAPDHFVRWLEQEGGGETATFAERRRYGRYIEALLAEAKETAGERLQLIEGDAVESVPHDGELIRLADGRQVQTDAAVLSIGNLEPDLPRGIDPAELGDLYIPDPWASDITAGLGRGDTVLLIGTGLTAVDAALSLDAAGFQGRIVALSRRGLIPRAHAAPAPVPPLDRQLEPRCASLVRAVRMQAKTTGWRAAVDQLRPVTQQLWASASPAERRRFLKHLRPWWDVHRHRIAPQIAERIAAMEQEGRLQVAAGKLLSAKRSTVRWRPRGSEETREITISRIVNCTGPLGNLEHTREPLLAGLLTAGRIRPDICRIGIDVDERLRVIGADGRPAGSLYAIGPMTRGALWEIVAVPDIRVQVERLARQLKG